MALSERQEIVASEDIVDDHGVKLWARGQKVSRSLQEKLLRHRLVRPLETTLTVEGGIVSELVVTECLALIDGNEAMQLLCGSRNARSLLAGFRNCPLPGPFKLLLTSARETGLTTYHHCLHSVAISAGIAARLGLSDQSTQQLLLAALIHDIGELYVNPDYLRSKAPLAPSEWRQVAVHPRIGQMLITQITTLSTSISTAVAEHHERLDGSGYPAQSTGAAISRLGRILAVADTATAIVASAGPHGPSRLAIAIRIVPEEFDRSVVNALIEPLNGMANGIAAESDGLARIRALLDRMTRSTQVAEGLAAHEVSAIAADTGGYVLEALNLLGKALYATGAAEACELSEFPDDQDVLSEICLVAREVEWRLRNLARNIHLRVHLNHDGVDFELVEPLICALDQSQPG